MVAKLFLVKFKNNSMLNKKVGLIALLAGLSFSDVGCRADL